MTNVMTSLIGVVVKAGDTVRVINTANGRINQDRNEGQKR